MSESNRQTALKASVDYWGTAFNRSNSLVVESAKEFLAFLTGDVNDEAGKNLDPAPYRVRNKWGDLSSKRFVDSQQAHQNSRSEQPIKVEFRPRPAYNQHEADYS